MWYKLLLRHALSPQLWHVSKWTPGRSSSSKHQGTERLGISNFNALLTNNPMSHFGIVSVVMSLVPFKP